MTVRSPTSTAARPRSAERGQTLGVIVVFMFVSLGMCALAIDVGSWYQARRAAQSAADAAALAGASQLPAGWSYAQNAATSEFSNNRPGSDTATYQNTTTNTANDSVKVTVSGPSASFFAKLFGINTANISASATATVLSYTSVVSTGQVMPWGVMKSSFTLGAQYSLYVDNSTPNNGALNLKGTDGNGNCQGTSGANDYSNEINGNLPVCDISLGDTIPVKTGQNTGPTKQGIDQRITSWDPITSIVQFTANGQAIILKPTSPQLVLIPIVTDMNGGTTWPSGSGSVRVVGFAYFVLSQPGYTQGGKQVLGTFVGLQNDNDAWQTGAWQPGSSSAYTAQLTS